MNKSGPNRLSSKMRRFMARIARNSQLLRKIRNAEAVHFGGKMSLHDVLTGPKST